MNNKALFLRLFDLGKRHGGYFITTLINSAIPLLFLPLLTRYLSPAEYANIALFNFYLLLSNSLSGTAIPIAVSKDFYNKPREYTAQLVGNSVMIVSILSFILIGLIVIFRHLIGRYIDLPPFWIIAVPVTSLFFIIFNLGLTVMRNDKSVRDYSFHIIKNTAINVIFSILLVVVMRYGWQGRLWGILLSYLISAVWAIQYLKNKECFNFKYSRPLSKHILDILLPLVPNSFQTVVISQVGVFFMQYYFTKDILGLYAVGYQISFAIRLLFNTLVLSWSPFLYEQLSGKIEINKPRIARMFMLLSGVLVLGGIFVIVFAGIILKIFTTKNYAGATEFIPWFTVGNVFQGLYIFMLPILIKNGKQNYLSVISFINMILMIIFNLVFIKGFGYIGITYAYSLTYLCMLIPIAYKTNQLLPLPWKKSLFLSNK
jgi:O-antigen/teichoic acid export membrane protein